MGVLNVTPDSFSDGGRYADPTIAIATAAQMVTDGADLIDIGGESTRPGSQPVPAAEQIRRVTPVIAGIMAAGLPVTLSIDTTRAEVGQAALDAGATVLNDISAGLDDPQMLHLAAKRRVPIVLMHMKGTPADMQASPSYSDVVAEVSQFLLARATAAIHAGVPVEHVLLDPGIGFGKTMTHNLQLLAALPRLAALGHPLLVGTSRKKFIGTLTGDDHPADRVFGTAASVGWAIANGAAVVRVHDVGAMVKVVRVVRAILDPAQADQIVDNR
jgi:dihydropteroate synthase